MSDSAYLALMLDSPMQSWGFASRFQRRATGMQPTKSGVIGLICAAIGLPKGSHKEHQLLQRLAALKMTSITIPRMHEGKLHRLPLRLEDYHTVLGTRRASGAINNDAVITYRQYLMEACFGVILDGDGEVLEKAAASLQDPLWGAWLGRKSCIPAAPICRGIFSTAEEAQQKLIGSEALATFTIVTEVDRFEEGTDSISDQPVSFGDGMSSGPDKRQFAPRRIRIQPASQTE